MSTSPTRAGASAPTKLTGWHAILPAYGRDYSSARAAKQAFWAGHDFQLAQTGQYCSMRDFASGACAEIRYDRLRKVTVECIA